MSEQPVNDIYYEDELHEEEVQFALTEPRHAFKNFGDIAFIEEGVFEGFEVGKGEITAFIMRWENLPIEDYIQQHKTMQIEPLRMIVNGETLDITSSDVEQMRNDASIQELHQYFPPVGPGSPIISNIEIRGIDPDTAVTFYHRTEYDKKGKPYESESALILVRQEGRWKAAVFSRRPLPRFVQKT